MGEDGIVILCTAPDAEVGHMLARGLVKARLAACVNVVAGVSSVYVWDGDVQEESEVQLLIKSRRELLGEVDGWLARHHPYDVPEVVALSIIGGSATYLAWLASQTAREPEG